MSRQKTMKISEGFTDKTNREEFFRLPRLEFLINEAKPDSAKGIGKMVMNQKLEIPDRFSMEVPDNRMAEAGIRQGDFVIIQKQRSYKAGDVLAVRLGDKAFVRRYFPSTSRIRLECGTPEEHTMILDMDTPGFSILGCVLQVIREI